MKQVDVLVVGGGCEGMYFAGRMAAQGYKVLVCEKLVQEKLGSRYTVIHIGQSYFGDYGIPAPKPGDPDYIRMFDKSKLRSAFNRWEKVRTFPILVLDRLPLMQRFASFARERGAEILFDTAFQKPMFENGKLTGGVFSKAGETFEVKARLTADASGIPAVVRTALPPDYGVENYTLGPADQSFVILYYFSEIGANDFGIPCVTSWPHYRVWIAGSDNPKGGLVGVGNKDSFEKAENTLNAFLAKGYIPKYRVEKVEKCVNTRHRTPYSLVADGFVALGDAACIANPLTGEGVPDGWRLCSIAAEVFAEALKGGAYPTREAAWPVNTRYVQEQGASYAGGFASRLGLAAGSDEENDYQFAHGIFYRDDRDKEESLAAKLEDARKDGGLSAETIRGIEESVRGGEEMRRHYLAYPKSPAGMEAWEREANRLWESVEKRSR